MTGSNHEQLAPPAASSGGQYKYAPAADVIAQLEASHQLDWLLAYVLRAVEAAYAGHDSRFPESDCATLLSAVPISELELRGDIAEAALNLVRGATSNSESLEAFGHLSLLAMTRQPTIATPEFAQRTRQMLWLECNSKLALLTLLPKILQARQVSLTANTVAGLLTGAWKVDRPLSRGEKYVALVWLESLEAAHAGDLAQRARQAIIPAIPSQFGGTNGQARTGAQFTLSGTLAAVPRSAVATAIEAFTGWLLIRQVADFTLRVFLAYRAKAEIRVTEKGLEIHEKRSLLGRRFRERTSVVTMHEVRRLSREVRYARAGTYAGLVALCLGSFLGMRLFVDGLRVPGFSGQLLWLGLLLVVGGLCLDFAFANWFDATRGRCRFLVVTERGKGFCLADVEPSQVDAMLSQLAKQLVKAT